MKKLLLIVVITALCISGIAMAADQKQSMEFSNRDGAQIVRTITPGGGSATPSVANTIHRPITNPHIMAQVVWVDRAHENAIAENTAITPDGSSIFAGWWLNNMRYAAYVSAGLELPLWKYYQQNQWQMPVGVSNSNYSGTGSGLPDFIWEKDSPLPMNQVTFDPGYSGAGTAFSGDGNLLATVASNGSDDGILVVYNMTTQDTVLTRHFVPTQGLYGVDISADGSRVVVSNYGQLYVYTIPDGELVGTLYNYSQGVAKISGDGTRVVTGTYSGLVYLYHWNGSQYTIQWSRNTLHDWVTAVDISKDGSTVACGTMDFVGGQIVGGKFEWWNAATGDTIYSYDQYGDEVSSVALSADGRYAIAGSYGQYGTTFGDVVTCFIRDTNVPIFQLLDDIDEVGSIFSVAISDSGRYACAGGKAVHAREFGNGGMLYSIKINDPMAHDVAIASIDAPGEFLAPGENASPTATFINVGTNTETFPVTCTITNLDSDTIVYTSTDMVSDLISFGSSQIVFTPDFTMPFEGRFRMDFSAQLDGDNDPDNNDLSLLIRSWHDLTGLAVVSPADTATVGWPVIPIATYKNIGSYYESVDISVSIQDSTGAEVFSTISSISDLAPYGQENIQFDSWIPDVKGTYRAVFAAMVDGDITPANDTIVKTFTLVQEMMYDDGTPELTIWVGDYPSTANRKFGIKFAPNIPAPFTVSNVRFFRPSLADTNYFDNISIAPDADGLPDTTDVLGAIEMPVMPDVGTWGSYDFNINRADDTPLWFILHWPDVAGVYGPYVGADNNGVLGGQSYWYADDLGWNTYPANWMMRMTLTQPTGVESDIVVGLPKRVTLAQNYPNPFNPSTNIEFGLPNFGNVELVIYNNLGQKVRTLVSAYFDAGYHTVVWNGKTDSGKDVASGVYYYRLASGDYRVSRKMLMMK